MNIVVYSSDTGDFFFKPDNTLVRDSKDFFPPGFVTEMSVTLAFVVRISKSCKCTSLEYARRYYNECGLGLLIFPDNLLNSPNSDSSCSGKAHSLDNTTYISGNFHNITEIGEIGEVSFLLNNIIISERHLDNDIQTYADQAIENITRYSSLKSGDLICIVYSDRTPVTIGNNIKICHSGETSLDFNIR